MMSHTEATTGARSKNLLDIYLSEIKDDALLTAAEETSLAGEISRGNKEARTRMIQANLRLVVRIARDYTGRGLSLDDLIGEGNLGLIRASVEFDPDFGTRFSTYAGYWIKQAIRHALINTTTTIRLPSYMVGLLTRWRRAERSLAREFGQAPTEEQIAVNLGLTDSQFEMVRSARRAGRLQLESGLTGEANAWSPDEAADHRETPEAPLEAADERQLLGHRLDRLDDRERMVISLRFGLNNETPQTLKEVGRRLGVTREWVRKIELRAIGKLEESNPSAPIPARKSPRSGSTPRSRRFVRPLVATA
jgi:RNA polymerase primary sigma factor